MRDGTRTRSCPKGCPGELVPIETTIASPDYWVRVLPSGAWSCSSEHPEVPAESPGRLMYRCATCRALLRIVARS